MSQPIVTSANCANQSDSDSLQATVLDNTVYPVFPGAMGFCLVAAVCAPLRVLPLKEMANNSSGNNINNINNIMNNELHLDIVNIIEVIHIINIIDIINTDKNP